MIKITIKPYTKYSERGETKGWAVIRENGHSLFFDLEEKPCVLKAWYLVQEYGLTLVEPW